MPILSLALLAASAALDVSVAGGCVDAAELERELRARVEAQTSLAVDVVASGGPARRLDVAVRWSRGQAAAEGAFSRTLEVQDAECVDAALLTATVVIASLDAGASPAAPEPARLESPTARADSTPSSRPLILGAESDATRTVERSWGDAQASAPSPRLRGGAAAGVRASVTGLPLLLRVAALGIGAVDVGAPVRMFGVVGIEGGPPVTLEGRTALWWNGVLGVGVGLPIKGERWAAEPVVRIEGGPAVVMGLEGASGLAVVPSLSLSLGLRVVPTPLVAVEPAVCVRAWRVGVRVGDVVYEEPFVGASLTIAVGGSA